MKRFDKRISSDQLPTAEVHLSFDERQRARNRVESTKGEELGLFIERGTSLRDGDRLQSSDGSILLVRAAPESLSVVVAKQPLELARIAYHLGNRHVPIQILENTVRYRHDHVLDDMLERMGHAVTAASLPFEPESGAYSHGHSHGHSHGEEHSHEHPGEHTHSHPHHDHPHNHGHGAEGAR